MGIDSEKSATRLSDTELDQIYKYVKRRLKEEQLGRSRVEDARRREAENTFFVNEGHYGTGD